MVDAARLADELRAEQDHTNSESKAKRALETQLGEMETRLTDAEDAAMRSGKTAMGKLEMRVRELEEALGNTQNQTSEYTKGYQRTQRKVKELLFTQDEDRKNQERMSELAAKLQQKIKTTNSKLKKLRKLLLLTLLSSGKLNRNWRKLRR